MVLDGFASTSLPTYPDATEGLSSSQETSPTRAAPRTPSMEVSQTGLPCFNELRPKKRGGKRHLPSASSIDFRSAENRPRRSVESLLLGAQILLRGYGGKCPEQSVGFIIRAGGEEQRGRWSGAAIIAEAKCPQSINQHRAAIRIQHVS